MAKGKKNRFGSGNDNAKNIGRDIEKVSQEAYRESNTASVQSNSARRKNRFGNTASAPKTEKNWWQELNDNRSEERKPGDIRAFGAGEYKSNKADKTVNAGVGYSVASYKKLLSDAARPTGELTMGQSAQAAVKGISQQEAEKQKRKESKANEWSKSLNESAVDWYEKAQENEAEAREGLGYFGNLLVSAGIAGTQMAGDTALNLIAPGSGIYAMAGRAYGSGSLEAQAEGLSEGQQQIAGVKSAAIETLTEKLFGFGSKVAYGSGLVKTPKLIESAITRLAKTNAGRTALRVLVGANEEGLEEVLSDLLNPIADRLLGLDSGTGNVYADLEASQVLEDYLVGGILGMFGGGTQVISGETKRINEQQRAAEEEQRDLVGKGLDSAEGTHSRLLAEEYNKILADSGKRGHRYLYDDEVNNLQTALDMENRSGNAPNAEAFNTAQQIKAQQDAAMRAQGARVFGNNDISSDIAKAVADNNKNSPSVKNEIGVKVSDAVESKTAVLDSGAKAKISNIEVKDGKVDKVVVETDGEVRKVSPEEVTVDSTTAKLLGDSVLYGEDAPMLMSYYQQGEDVDKYISAFDAAYNLYGKGGVEAVENSSVKNALGAERFNEIVKLGRAVAPAKATVKKTKNGKGSISYDGGVVDGKTLKAVDITKLTKEQAQQTKVIEQIAEKFGINFVFYESEVKDGKYTGANGAYTDNTIYLDINAGKNYEADPVAIVRTAAHEMTHYMQAASPELYAEFKAVIVDKLINSEYLMGKGITFEDLVNGKMRRSKGTISEAEAVDEVIADACEMMLKDSKAMRTIMRENQKVGEKIKTFLKDFFRKMHEIFKNLSTAFPEAKALLDEQGKYLDDLQAKWDAMLVASAKSDTYTYESEVQEMTNENGETVVVADNNGHAQASLRTYREGGREALEKYLDRRIAEGAIDKSERNDMLKQMDTMYQICENYAKEYSLFGQWAEAEVRTDPVTGEPIFSVVKANGDYALNLDFSLVCKKRRTLDAVFNKMISQGIMDDFDMVERSIAAINDIIRENDFETACALCFVDTKRYRQAMVADSFVRIYNGLVRSMVKDSSQKLTYFNFGENKALINPANGIHTLKDSDLDFTKIEQFLHNPKYMPKQKKDGGYTTGSVEYRVAKLLKESPQDRQLLQRGDFMSTKGFDNVRQHNTRVLGLYNAKKGAGGPKAAQSDVQYLSEILTQKKFNPKAAYAVGGVRVQSFSDYIPRLVFDYVQMMTDLAAKDLPAHAYTKEPLFALQFGKTGMKINMSLVPEVVKDGVAPGLDKDGNYAWRDGQSFGSTVYGGSEEFVRKCYDIIGKEYNGQDRLTAQEGYELAMAIQNEDGYHNNCGIIAVGVSNAHILKLIRDPNIRMVIPYHKSSLNHLVAVMTNVDKYVDYTKKQNTRLASGKKLESGDFNFNEALRRLGNAKAAADEYLAWCDEHNYIPKFEDFRNEENYYKLLEDFTCYDRDGNAAPQGAVQVNFPTADDAFGSMSDLIEMGLIEDTNLNAKETAKVPEIVKQIKATLPELEQKWKDEANAKKKPKKVQKSDRDSDGNELSKNQRQFSRRGVDTSNMDAGAKEIIGRLRTRALGSLYMQGEYASYNAERIDREIRASSSTSPAQIDYAKSYIAWVDPIDFLYATTTNRASREIIEQEAGTLDLDKLREETQPIYLRVDFETGRILGHEGRHRMVALSNAGVSKAAVIFDAVNDDRYNTKPVDIMKLYGQRFGENKSGMDFYAHDMLPLSARYADAVRTVFSELENSVQFQERELRTDREILSTALESAAKNENERGMIKDYQRKVKTVEKLEQNLRDARQELADARKAKDKDGISKAQNRVNILADKVAKEDAKLLKLQAAKPLQNVLTRAKQVERETARVQRRNAVDKAVARERAQKQKELERVRESRDAQIKKLKEHNREVNENRRERTHKTAEWHKIFKMKDYFDGLINSPKKADGGHAPIAIAQAFGNVANCFNVDNRQRSIGGLSSALGKLKSLYASMEKDPALGIYYNEELYGRISEVEDAVNATLGEELTSEQLNAIYKILRFGKQSITNANKFLSRSIDKSITEAGRECSREIDNANVSKGRIAGYLNWQLRPDTFFKRLGGFVKNSMWENVQSMFTEGTEKMLKIQQDFYLHFREYTESKKFLALSKYDEKNLVDIGLKDENGEAIKVTRDMMLSIYKHLSSEDNLVAFARGGFKVPSFKEYYRGKSRAAYDDGIKTDCMDAKVWGLYRDIDALMKTVKSETASEEDKAEAQAKADEIQIEIDRIERAAFSNALAIKKSIEDAMTDYEKEFIEASVAWMDKSAQYINEVSERMYGFKKAEVTNYWTIHRDMNFVNTDIRSSANEINLENWGSLKERVRSDAPILLTGFSFELDNHTRQMSQFCGFAEVQRDFNKLYNTRLPSQRSSLSEKVQRKFGSGEIAFGQSGQQYIDAYIEAVSGAKKNADALSAVYSNLARATLSINLRVAVSQLASIPTAAAEIGWGSMAKGAAQGAKIAFSTKAKNELAAKNPWFWQRYRGEGGMQEFAAMHEDSFFTDRVWNKFAGSKVGSKLVNWCQDFDCFATSMMWAMAEDYVKTNTDYTGEQFDKAVADKYRDIIRKTQPNYTVTERSGLLREKRGGIKLLTMYKTQSNQNLNILYDANKTFNQFRRDFRDGKNGVTEADVNEARKKLAWAYTSVLIGGSLSFAVLRAVANAILHNLKGYEDDDDELTFMSVMNGILKETGSAVAGMVVFGSQLYDIAIHFMTKGTYYGITDSAFNAISSVVEDSIAMIDGGFEKDGIIKACKSWANILGIPANNVMKIAEGMVYYVEDIKNGELYSAGHNRTAKQNYSRIVRAASEGDFDKVEEIIGEAIENSEAKDAEKSVRNGLKKAVIAYYSGEEEGHPIEIKQAVDILVKCCNMNAQDAYDKLTSAKTLQDYLEEHSDEYDELMEKADADGNGSITQDEAKAALNSVSLPKNVKSAIWQSINGSWKTNPYG